MNKQVCMYCLWYKETLQLLREMLPLADCSKQAVYDYKNKFTRRLGIFYAKIGL